MSQKKIPVPTLNTIINALEFYYGEILKKHFIFEVKSPKKDKKLLVVLSKEEKDLRCLHKYKTQNPLLILMYSSELKVGEVVRLKPKNIDSERILIHIKGSKRRKDRYTILSRSAMVVLKKYYAQYKPRR